MDCSFGEKGENESTDDALHVWEMVSYWWRAFSPSLIVLKTIPVNIVRIKPPLLRIIVFHLNPGKLLWPDPDKFGEWFLFFFLIIKLLISVWCELVLSKRNENISTRTIVHSLSSWSFYSLYLFTYFTSVFPPDLFDPGFWYLETVISCTTQKVVLQFISARNWRCLSKNFFH